MSSPINQASFIGGELSPSLHARVDLQRYTQGLKLCRNFVIHPHGGVANRAGSAQIGLAKSQDGSTVRLIRFAPSAEEQYILEFGEHYIRIWSGTEPVFSEDRPLIAGNDEDPAGDTTKLVNDGILGVFRSQKFTTPNAETVISAVEIRVGRQGVAQDIRIEIWSDAGGSPGAPITGLGAARFSGPGSEKPIANPSAIPETLDPPFSRYTTDTPVTFPANTTLHLIVGTSNNPWVVGDPYILVGLSFGSSYPGGIARYNNGVSWVPFASDLSLCFNILGPAAALVEIVTPYTAAQIQRLVTTQSVDVMTITDPSHVNLALELKRFTPAIWTLTPIAAFVSYGEPLSVDLYSATTHPTDSPTHDWQYAVSGVKNNVESLPTISPVIAVGADVSESLPVPLLIAASNTEKVEYFNVYKGFGETFGFIGTVRTPAASWNPLTVTNWQFRDENFSPDYTDQPRQGTNPFNADGDRKPAVCSIFQQRFVFANWAGKPDTIALSETADYKTFDVSVPRTPDDAIEATIASGGLDEIRALVPLADLLIFTAAAEYVANGSGGVVGGDPIIFDASPRSHRGSQWLQPIVAGDIVLFYDAAGHIREWVFDQTTNSFPASDLTLLASHLFTGRYVTAWAYTQAPHSVVWLVLDDGTFLSLTYLREQSVAAWARHDTQGRVRSIVQARDGLADCLYLVVERDGFGIAGDESRTFIERILARDPATSRFLDCAVTVSDRPDATVTFALGVDFLVGENVGIVVAGGSTFVSGDWIAVSCPGGEIVRVKIIASTGPLTYSVELLDDVPAAALSSAALSFALSKDRWGGFDSLAGKTVGIIADGDPHAEVVVGQDGFIQLERHATDVTAGLTYVSRLETLKLSVQSGDIRTRPKAINKVWLDVLDTRGAFAGQARDDGLPVTFYELKQSQLERPVAQSDRVEIGIDASWNRGGGLVIEQRSPLPCEILALTPEVTVAS